MKNKKGFTLLEVLIALSVFIIGVVSLFPVVSGGLKLLGDGDVKLTVATLAQSKMAEIEAAGFNEVASDVSRIAFPSPNDTFEYAITWTPALYDIADATTVVLRKAELMIYWTSRSGVKSKTFTTYVSRLE